MKLKLFIAQTFIFENQIRQITMSQHNYYTGEKLVSKTEVIHYTFNEITARAILDTQVLYSECSVAINQFCKVRNSYSLPLFVRLG